MADDELKKVCEKHVIDTLLLIAVGYLGPNKQKQVQKELLRKYPFINIKDIVDIYALRKINE